MTVSRDNSLDADKGIKDAGIRFISALPETWLVNLLHDSRPHLPMSGIVRRARLAADAHHCADGPGHRAAVTAEQDDRRCPETRKVDTGHVDHMRQIDDREEPFHKFLAELSLHERVGRDHPNETGGSPVLCGKSQFEEPLREWNAERVLPVAS